jgi:hypothetical protein
MSFAVRETLLNVVEIHLGKYFFDGGFRGSFAHDVLVVPRIHGGIVADPRHQAEKGDHHDSQRAQDDDQCVTAAVPPYGSG